jgi:hypothetical protein
MLGHDQSRYAEGVEIKQRRVGFAVSSEAAVTPGRPVRQRETVMSPAVKQLNRDGYAVYNSPEKQDIYVTVQPESAFFEDEEPEMVRMAGGVFVGANKSTNHFEVPVRSEPESRLMAYDQPADIFSNASRREVYDEINFNEIIIKKNESFEKEIEQQPALFVYSPETVCVPVMRETLGTAAAAVSSAAAETEIPGGRSFMGCAELPDRKMEEAADVIEKVSAEETYVTDVPAGLYVDGYRRIDIAETGTAETNEMLSFIGVSMEAETVITSEAASVPKALPPADYVRYISAPEEDNTAEIMLECASETVAALPAVTDIIDPVADIMKLTVPELLMSEDLLSDIREAEIPDDGLESYDFKFASPEMSYREASRAMTFGF